MYTKPLMRSLQILNVLIFQKFLVLMHCVKTCSDVPYVFVSKFNYSSHRCTKSFSKNNFAITKYQKPQIKIYDIS